MKVSYVKNSLLFVVTFFVSVICLKLLIPKKDVPANIYSYSAKLSHFIANKNDYEVLFIGTSRVHNQVSPEVFDRTLQEAGYPYQSFNFGLQGARILTTYFMVEEILATQPKNLKWVFIENLLDAGYSPIQNARTPREIHFHNWERTQFSISYVVDSDSPFYKKSVIALSHLPPFFFSAINLGRVVDQFQVKSEAQLAEELGDGQDGYILSPQKEIVAEDYLRKVEQLAQNPHIDTELSANHLEILSLIVEAIEDYGARPIFLVAPGIIRNDELISAAKAGYIDNILIYNNPNQYPALYEIANRSDEEHLNEQGSILFSTLLAQDFVNTLQLESCEEKTASRSGLESPEPAACREVK